MRERDALASALTYVMTLGRVYAQSISISPREHNRSVLKCVYGSTVGVAAPASAHRTGLDNQRAAALFSPAHDSSLSFFERRTLQGTPSKVQRPSFKL